MEALLEIRDKILEVYSLYEIYFDKVLKFFTVLLCLMYINGLIGYQETLSGIMPTLLISLICTLIPSNFAVAILAMVIIVQLFTLAIEAAVVGGLLILLLLLLYFRFSPRDTILLFLYPTCNMIGISYALPIAGGLLFSPASGFTVAVGVIIDRYLRFVQSNETVIGVSGTDTEDIIARFQYLIDGILQDRVMTFKVLAVVIGAVLVYIVRRLAIQYAWIIAAGIGAVAQLVVILIGAISYDTEISVFSAFFGVAASFLIGICISFISFNLDYARIENTQFEDDDYYYYVKAVPKNSYARPRRTVKTINRHRNQEEPQQNRRGTTQRYYSDNPSDWETGMISAAEAGMNDSYDTYPGEDRYQDDGYQNDGYADDFMGDEYGGEYSDEY